MYFHLCLTTLLSAFLAIAAPMPAMTNGDPLPVPKICSASDLTDRPTVKLFKETMLYACEVLFPEPTSVFGTPQHTSMHFDIPQPDNKPAKSMVTNIDYIGSDTAFLYRGVCVNGFGVGDDFHGIETVWGEQVEMGNICMKEGGEMPGNRVTGADDWLVLGWGNSQVQNYLDGRWANVTLKFE